ncbi:hypothetical protein Hanom_Chr17g01584131 [Helianthus anomalus]
MTATCSLLAAAILPGIDADEYLVLVAVSADGSPVTLHFLYFLASLVVEHLVGSGSRSLSELVFIMSRLTAGCRGDFSFGESGGWLDLVGDGIIVMDFGRESVFLSERRSKSGGEFRLGVAGWSTGRPLMSDTVSLESEEHMIDG